MSNVLRPQFGSQPRRPEISFKDRVMSGETSSAVSGAIATLIKRSDYLAPSSERVVVEVPKEVTYGLCYTTTLQPPESTKLLVINKAFPAYLHMVGAIETLEDAQQACAIYARALDVMQGALELTRRARAAGSRHLMSGPTFEPSLWQSNPSAPFVAPYRAAATVMHEATVAIDLPKPVEGTAYPLHIASLHNPLPVAGAGDGFIALSDVLQQHARSGT